MKQHKDKLWLIGFIIGPLFAWLCYAVQRKRWVMVFIALAANVAFWWGGLTLLNFMYEWIQQYGK